MSKRKDRLYTEYRNCPVYGKKTIYIWKTKKIFHKEKTYIHCYMCHKDIEVKEKINNEN